MFTLSSSALNFIIAICLIVLTFFISWAIYYFALSIHKIYKLVKRVESGVSKAEDVLDIARNKLKNSGAYFMILGEIAKKALSFVEDKREQKKTRKTRKK